MDNLNEIVHVTIRCSTIFLRKFSHAHRMLKNKEAFTQGYLKKFHLTLKIYYLSLNSSLNRKNYLTIGRRLIYPNPQNKFGQIHNELARILFVAFLCCVPHSASRQKCPQSGEKQTCLPSVDILSQLSLHFCWSFLLAVFQDDVSLFTSGLQCLEFSTQGCKKFVITHSLLLFD